jgi:hypothetical protein
MAYECCSNSLAKGVTTGHIDHKITGQLKFDELSAILAIVSVVGDAEYVLGEGMSPVDRRYFERRVSQIYL